MANLPSGNIRLTEAEYMATERGIPGCQSNKGDLPLRHLTTFSWLACQKLSQVGTGNQVLGDQDKELN